MPTKLHLYFCRTREQHDHHVPALVVGDIWNYFECLNSKMTIMLNVIDFKFPNINHSWVCDYLYNNCSRLSVKVDGCTSRFAYIPQQVSSNFWCFYQLISYHSFHNNFWSLGSREHIVLLSFLPFVYIVCNIICAFFNILHLFIILFYVSLLISAYYLLT